MKQPPVFDAIRRSAADELEALLEKQPRLANVRDSLGLPPLQLAAADPALVAVLLSKGARVHERAGGGETALHHATGTVASLRLLLEAGADCNAANGMGMTPLYHAVSKDATQSVEVLLAAGADLRTRTTEGETLLHLAARLGYLDMVRLLLAKGIDVDARGPRARTPLLEVAGAPRQRDELALAAKALLAAGADPLARDEDGNTPLHLAARGGHAQLIAALACRPEVLDARNNQGDTPLMVAAAVYPLSNLRALVAAGAELEARNDAGRTALHHAALSSRSDCVEALLELGADPHARDGEGRTPLDLAWSSTRSQDILAAATGIERVPRVRLGFIYEGDRGATVLETLPAAPAHFVADRIDSRAIITTLHQESRGWAFRAHHEFDDDDTVETMLERVNPFWRKVGPTDYDAGIVIGRFFAFCRHDEEADQEFLRWLGIGSTPAILPRFGINQEGQSEIDLHLDPFARPAPEWPTLAVVSTTRPVYAAGDDVTVFALCLETAAEHAPRITLTLTTNGVEVPRSRQHVSIKGGLAVARWKALPAGLYAVVMQGDSLHSTCAFTVGAYSLSLAHAEWVEGPHHVEDRWTGRARVFVRGVPLPPGVEVELSAGHSTAEAITYDDGLLDVDLSSGEALSVRVAWRDQSEEVAHLPLPPVDRLEACGVRVSTVSSEGSEAVNGLHFTVARVEGAPLQLVHPVGDQLTWRVLRDTNRAAVTSMFPGQPVRTRDFGPLRAGDALTVDLPDGARDIGFMCVGAMCGDELFEAAVPVCRPPALRVSTVGPPVAQAGAKVRVAVRVEGPAAKRAVVAALVQDVRLHCGLEREAAAQRMTDLARQYGEVEGPPPPRFSEAWLDGTFRIRLIVHSVRRRGQPQGTILVDLLPAQSGGGGMLDAVGGALAGLFSSAPHGGATSAHKVEATPMVEDPPAGQTVFADLVKSRQGTAEISFSAPAHPCTLSVQVLAVDAATATWTSCRTTVRICAPVELFTDAVTPAMMPEDAGRVTGRLSLGSTVGSVHLQASVDGDPVNVDSLLAADPPIDVRLPLRPGLFTIQANAGGHAITRTFRVRRSDRLTERVRRMVVLSEGQRFRATPGEHVHEVRLATLDEVLRCSGKALADYTHKCCEQTAAAMIGAWGTLLSPNGDGRLRALGSLSAGLVRLDSMWRDNGFALYPNVESPSDHWGRRTYRHLTAMQRFGRSLAGHESDAARRILDKLESLVRRCIPVYGPIARDDFEDCHEAWLASDSVAALHAVSRRWEVVSRDGAPLAGCVTVDGDAVATRAETCYASAVLLEHETSRRRYLAEIQGALTWMGSQMKEGGRLYSTPDSSALVALLATARAWLPVTGMVSVDGETPLAPAAARARIERGVPREITCTEGQVQLLIDATVETDFEVADTGFFTTRFEIDGREVGEARLGAAVDLVVSLSAYEAGHLAHFVLPPCLALEEGGTRLQAFQRDFEGARTLTVPLRTICLTGPEPWHGVIAVRNMFREEVQAGERVGFVVR